MKWEPIETAYKGPDAPEVIVGCYVAGVWITRGAHYVRAEEWVSGSDEEEVDGWWSYRNSVGQELLEGIFEPTHWIPMPELPEIGA